MVVRVKLFGPAARAAGRDEVDVALEAERSCAALGRRLADVCSELRTHVSEGRFAVNHAFVDASHEIEEGDEVALISMVSGG